MAQLWCQQCSFPSGRDILLTPCQAAEWNWSGHFITFQFTGILHMVRTALNSCHHKETLIHTHEGSMLAIYMCYIGIPMYGMCYIGIWRVLASNALKSMLLSETLGVCCVFESFVLHYWVQSQIGNLERLSLGMSCGFLKPGMNLSRKAA